MQSILPSSITYAVDHVGLELFVAPPQVDAKRNEAERLPALELDEYQLQWVQVLSEGWAYPLRSFMRERELLQCLHFGCLVDGTDCWLSFSSLLILLFASYCKILLSFSLCAQLKFSGNNILKISFLIVNISFCRSKSQFLHILSIFTNIGHSIYSSFQYRNIKSYK